MMAAHQCKGMGIRGIAWDGKCCSGWNGEVLGRTGGGGGKEGRGPEGPDTERKHRCHIGIFMLQIHNALECIDIKI